MSSSEYRRRSVPVISSPVVDAAVIEARARGYADGLAQAREQAAKDTKRREEALDELRQEVRDVAHHAEASLLSAATQVSQQKVKSLNDVKDSVFSYAVEIAEAILSMELTDASVAARSAINRVLSVSSPSPLHTVRLNPEAYGAAMEAGIEIPGVQLVSDSTLPRGGAVAEYQDGWLDAGLEDAMSRVRALTHEER